MDVLRSDERITFPLGPVHSVGPPSCVADAIEGRRTCLLHLPPIHGHFQKQPSPEMELSVFPMGTRQVYALFLS
jgi:hypothetical protein